MKLLLWKEPEGGACDDGLGGNWGGCMEVFAPLGLKAFSPFLDGKGGTESNPSPAIEIL